MWKNEVIMKYVEQRSNNVSVEVPVIDEKSIEGKSASYQFKRMLIQVKRAAAIVARMIINSEKSNLQIEEPKKKEILTSK